MPASSQIQAAPSSQDFRVPETERFQAQLQEKIDLILAAITPEKLAAASLSQLTSALKALTNRAQTLQDAATKAHNQYIDHINAYRQELANVLKRHVPDQKTLLAIGAEMDAYAGFPTPDSSGENSETGEISPVSSSPAPEPQYRHPSPTRAARLIGRFAAGRGAGGEGQSLTEEVKPPQRSSAEAPPRHSPA